MAKPAITKYSVKGSPLTTAELDTNLQNLKDATVSVADGTNTAVLDLNDTLNVVGSGGATVTVNASTKTLTVSTADTVNAFQTIAVSGQSNVVADATNDTLTLVAGTGITLTTNAGTDSITISGSGTGTVNTGGAGKLAYYPSNGTTVDDFNVSWDDALKVLNLPNSSAVKGGNGTPGIAMNDGNLTLISTSAVFNNTNTYCGPVSGTTDVRLFAFGTNGADVKVTSAGNIELNPRSTGKINLTPNTNNQAWLDSGVGNLRIQCGSNEFNAEYGQGLTISSGQQINLSLGSSNKLTVGSSNQNSVVTSNGTGTLKLTVADNGSFRPAITLGNASSDDVTLYTSGGDVVVDAQQLTTSVVNSNGSSLLLRTNSGASSGTINIGSGADQDIQIYPNGTGVVKLGGNLDLNGNEITSSGSGNITIATTSSGNIYLDAAAGVVQVVGDLDLQSGVIGTSATNTDIEIEPSGTGVIWLNGPIKTNATTGSPVDDTTPVSWLEVDVGGTLYFMPLYQ
jgi:hypothetical protein